MYWFKKISNNQKQIKPNLWFQSFWNVHIIFKCALFSNNMLSLMVSRYIYLGNSDYGLSWIMQRTLCTNTYQFHFFVLPMIFMPNPTAPYLCSQLASVTKGLCKQLLQANRFLSTSEETASYAAPICPPGMHKNMSPLFHFFPLVLTEEDGGRREEQEWESKQNEHWTRRLFAYRHSHFVLYGWLYRKPQACTPLDLMEYGC